MNRELHQRAKELFLELRDLSAEERDERFRAPDLDDPALRYSPASGADRAAIAAA